MTRLVALVLFAAVACARPKEEPSADSVSFFAVDTLKPAPPDTLANRDSAANVAKGTPTSTPAAKTPAKTPTGTKTAPATAKDTAKLGRDVAIPFDPKKPRLPPVDTTKKKPPLSS
jgi:hypothetical protein